MNRRAPGGLPKFPGPVTYSFVHVILTGHQICQHCTVHWHAQRASTLEAVQSCSVQGPAESLDSRTLSHFLKVPFGVRSKFDEHLVKLYSMRLSELQGTAPPSSVPLFPCSKSNMFNDTYMKYDL
jgi:hypothetical protein